MALIPSIDFPVDQVLFAYNNSVLEFASDDENKTPLYCDISIEGNLLTTIYPNPSKAFYYNFKELFPSIINENSFQDFTDIRFDPNDITTYYYSEDDNVYKELNLLLSVTYEDASVENLNRTVKLLRATIDIETYKIFQVGNLLTTNTVLTTYAENGFVGFPRVGYAKYFEGYPFDFTFLSPENCTLTNQTNLDSLSLTGLTKVTRLGISDGRTDTAIDLFFLISDGVNFIRLVDTSAKDVQSENPFQLKLIKDSKCPEGVYIKWLNNYGGWSYWLFNKNFQRSLSASSLGSINNDFNNLDQTTSPFLSIGKESQYTIRALSDNIEKEDNDLLITVLDSPKVYLFTGPPFAKNTYQDWIEVEVFNRNAITKQFKRDLNNIEFNFRLPEKNNMKL